MTEELLRKVIREELILFQAQASPPSPEEPILLSAAAERHSVSKATLLLAINSGELPAVRLTERGFWRVMPSEIRKFLSRNSNKEQVKAAKVQKKQFPPRRRRSLRP